MKEYFVAVAEEKKNPELQDCNYTKGKKIMRAQGNRKSYVRKENYD